MNRRQILLSAALTAVNLSARSGSAVAQEEPRLRDSDDDLLSDAIFDEQDVRIETRGLNVPPGGLTQGKGPAEQRQWKNQARASLRGTAPTTSMVWPPLRSRDPDLAHLETSTLAGAANGSFKLSHDVLVSFCAANGFDPAALAGRNPTGAILIGLRGCSLDNEQGNAFVGPAVSVDLHEAVPDYKHMRCVMGVWIPSARMVGVARASTVPNNKWMLAQSYAPTTQVSETLPGCAATRTVASDSFVNMMPTGQYDFVVGLHNSGLTARTTQDTKRDFRAPGAFRQASIFPTRRVYGNRSPLQYATGDIWDLHAPSGTNLHCSYPPSDYADFDSAGCNTVGGWYEEQTRDSIPWTAPVTPYGGWRDFRVMAGMAPNINLKNAQIAPNQALECTDDGRRYGYLLLTGREAHLHERARAGFASASSLKRLRFGSRGPNVRALAQALVAKGALAGAQVGDVFGMAVAVALIQTQICEAHARIDCIVNEVDAAQLNIAL